MERISGRQLILIGIACMISTSTLVIPGQLIAVGSTQTWMSYLSSFVPLVLIFGLIANVLKDHPGKDLFEVMIEAMPYLGKGLALLYVLYFCYIAARDLRMIVDFTNIALLRRTPLMIIALLIVFCVFFIARGGAEVLARMTELWLPALLIPVLLIPFGLIQVFDANLLKPFIAQDLFGPVVKGGWLLFPYYGEVIVLPFLYAGHTFKFRRGMIALGAGAALLLWLHFCIALSLGSEVAARSIYPTYEMVRQIKITDFLDRFELPLVSVYMPVIFIKVAISIYLVCHGLKRVFPALSAKLMTMPIGVLVYVASFWLFGNTIQMITFNEIWPWLALPFVLIIPVLLFVAVKIRRQLAASRS